jgi:hypothetical protein
MEKNKTTGRRDFLKMTAAGAAGIALASGVRRVFSMPAAENQISPLNKWPGRVAINFNKSALTSTGIAKIGDDQMIVIKKMMDDTILLLTREVAMGSDVGAAWKNVFPATLSASSKIAIKVNTRNSGDPAPHWSAVKAMTDGLLAMDVHIPAANITIYDMNNGSEGLSQAGYTTDHFPGGINIVTDTVVDGGDGAVNNRKYSSVLKQADFLINVFGARGHSIPPEGSQFSLGFKSHYGTYEKINGNSDEFHADVMQKIREFACAGPVYKKQVLNVCVGIFGTNEGKGPDAAADLFTKYAQKIDSTAGSNPTTIFMSTDPISAEMQGIKILRMNRNKAYGVADMPPYLQAAAGIDTAGFTPTHNLGIINEADMDIRRILNGQIVAVRNPALLSNSKAGAVIRAHQIKGHSTFIDFTLSHEHVGKDALLEIFDAQGALARSYSQKVLGVRNSLSWDERDVSGNVVSSGMYVIRLSSGLVRQSSQFSIIR